MEKKEQNEEQDDIESNLLLPAGVTLRSATLSLKVYRAEDMPQSESGIVPQRHSTTIIDTLLQSVINTVMCLVFNRLSSG